MGSHLTLDQRDRAAEALEVGHRGWSYDHTHKVREVEAEQAFDRLNPDFGVPADKHSAHHGLQAVRDRRPPSPSASGWRCMTAARGTIGTRLSGSPARTTEPPTPSTPPAPSPPGPAGAQSRMGPER